VSCWFEGDLKYYDLFLYLASLLLLTHLAFLQENEKYQKMNKFFLNVTALKSYKFTGYLLFSYKDKDIIFFSVSTELFVAMTI
jgi:hypothetical protein